MYSVIGVLSDAHGNSLAFKKAINLLLDKGAEHIFFLGDAVGYIPSPNVLDEIMTLGGEISCILGNHEAMLLEESIDGIKDQVYQLSQTKKNLSLQQINTIKNWPASLRLSLKSMEFLFIHGSPENHTFGYVYPDTNLSNYRPNADWIFMGNTHHPFIRKFNNINYVNVGSCGLPRDDGRYGSAALFNAETKNVSILRFDITQETKEMINTFPKVHSSVKKIYERTTANLVGDIL